MVSRTLENSIVIDRSPAEVFGYVSQPWRWHEWHPSSRSARATVETLEVGDGFDEVIQLQPLSLTITRQTHYQVVLSEPWLLKPRMRKLSALALANLKAKLERD